mmetsp:Transcript_22211/g.32799  ORF Transcript_22211/g.32799 Transcript_22211/m.32799 type:complete len:206 (+) Transcript_22211:517-1134(+)
MIVLPTSSQFCGLRSNSKASFKFSAASARTSKSPVINALTPSTKLLLALAKASTMKPRESMPFKMVSPIFKISLPTASTTAPITLPISSTAPSTNSPIASATPPQATFTSNEPNSVFSIVTRSKVASPLTVVSTNSTSATSVKSTNKSCPLFLSSMNRVAPRSAKLKTVISILKKSTSDGCVSTSKTSSFISRTPGLNLMLPNLA